MSHSIQDWCVKQHADTNHFYDSELKLPYKFHLKMVDNEFETYKNLLDDTESYPIQEEGLVSSKPITLREVVHDALWAHDMIEDARVNYNAVRYQMGLGPAEIAFALTNEKGRTRAERANEKYYEGIRNTPGAVFAKLCDRIANIKYSKLTQSRMFDTYLKENEHFMKSLGWDGKNHEYAIMFEKIIELLKP